MKPRAGARSRAAPLRRRTGIPVRVLEWLIARVVRINTTAVKSLTLDHPGAIELTADGAREDRRFLLVDGDGRLYNAKRDTTLVRSRASWDGETLTVTLPDGAEVSGRVAHGRPATTEVYGRTVAGHVVDGPWAEALSEEAGRELALIQRDDGAWATDSRPVTLVGLPSLAAFGADGRRFRMLFELDDLAAYEEDSWRGRRIRVGGATLMGGEPTPRCVVPSASPDTGVRDRDVLRDLLAVRGPIDGQPCLGVYADVLEPGLVRVGDTVALA